MVIRGAALLIALAPLSACSLWQTMKSSEQGVDCPSVTRASAWVDKMPTIGSAPHKMIVAAKLDDARPWLLTPVSTPDRTVRALALSPGGSAVPGNASYHEQVSQDMPVAISITCGGNELARIEKITIAM